VKAYLKRSKNDANDAAMTAELQRTPTTFARLTRTYRAREQRPRVIDG
jgi:hypothetical protein